MFLTGDDLVSALMAGGGAQMNFLNNWISVNLIQDNIRPLIGGQPTPLVKTISGNPVFYAVNEWIANGGCPWMNEFDAVEAIGNAIRIAEFTDPNDQAGVYPYAAAVFHHQADFNAKVVYMPYEFNNIMTPPSSGDKIPDPLLRQQLSLILPPS